MKQLINKPAASVVISIDDITKYSIIGLEALGNKYLLTPIFNDRSLKFGFLCGFSRWSSNFTVEALIKEALADNRCKVVVFDNWHELSKWMTIVLDIK